MKNSIIIIIIVVLINIAILIGASYSLNNIFNSKEDKTVKVQEEYLGPTKENNIIKVTEITHSNYNMDFKDIILNSQEVVEGKIIKVSYTVFKERVWTKLDFEINSSYKKNIKENSIISIFLNGGYIKLKDYLKFEKHQEINTNNYNIDNSVVKVIADEEETFKKGEKLVLCIYKTGKNSSLPNNSYERISIYGMLKVEGNKYIQEYTNQNKKIIYSKVEFKKLIK